MQGSSQALQERVAGLEAALRRQDGAVEKLQAGAKRHMEASLRQGTTRKSLQQATQKEDKLRQQVTRLEAELSAIRRSPHQSTPYHAVPHCTIPYHTTLPHTTPHHTTPPITTESIEKTGHALQNLPHMTSETNPV